MFDEKKLYHRVNICLNDSLVLKITITAMVQNVLQLFIYRKTIIHTAYASNRRTLYPIYPIDRPATGH